MCLNQPWYQPYLQYGCCLVLFLLGLQCHCYCSAAFIGFERGIESCGILAGRLSATDSRFTVTTLIVPKQTGEAQLVLVELSLLAGLQHSGC
jgi:hypothetical protein